MRRFSDDPEPLESIVEKLRATIATNRVAAPPLRIVADAPIWRPVVRAFGDRWGAARINAIDGYTAHARLCGIIRWWVAAVACGPTAWTLARPWLMIHGRPGTGKTHLLAAASNALADRRVPHRIRKFDGMVAAIKSDVYGGDSCGSIRDASREWARSPLLLDDFGASPTATPRDLEIIGALFDTAYDERTPMIVTTNATASWDSDRDGSVGAFVGPRTRSRIAELAVTFTCGWASLRPPAAGVLR